MSAGRERRVRSSRPNHIWLVDLTTVPTLAGFWISWLPWSVHQRWPFCCWVAVIIDHFSRRIMGVRILRNRPTAMAVSAFLASMSRAAGQSPRHLITDRGREPTARSLRRRCRRAGVHQRVGAIGKHGSIAMVERCIRTLSVQAEVAVCARAAQHAARRAIPVAVLVLGPSSPR